MNVNSSGSGHLVWLPAYANTIELSWTLETRASAPEPNGCPVLPCPANFLVRVCVLYLQAPQHSSEDAPRVSEGEESPG